MARKGMAWHMRRIMIREGIKRMWRGHDADLIAEAYEAAGGTLAHPLNRIDAVMNALARSKLFVCDECVRACDSNGRREILHNLYRLKKYDK